MDLSNSIVLPPHPPASAFREELLDGAADHRPPSPREPPPPQPEEHDGGDGSGGEDDEEDEDDDDEDEREQDASYGWHPMQEDRSLPCEDELKYIESKEEHSALDHSYWEKETFFALNDPELVPGESGRIEWTVEHFNGTKEKPNKELIMRSPVVRIGGYDWQIKFYPRGNRTDYLSVYLENVTMLDPGFKDRVDLPNPALPVLAGSQRISQRKSIAAQVSVVMYNPAEPRVYESKIDAHQYHQKEADFGWKYFNRYGRYEFAARVHGQRQAILRDDKLAFTAYIRIVNDPTGCMWDAAHPGTDGSLSATGLRPFDTLSPQIAAVMPLLHLRPFRDFLYRHKCESSLLTLLQTCLEKVLARRLKRKHLKYSTLPDGCDVVNVLQTMSDRLKAECPSEVYAEFESLFGSFSSKGLPVSDKRLETKNCASVQEAVRKTKGSKTSSAILTLELERQTFNKSKRQWEKITNMVTLDENIEHDGASYTLYAFVKHSGPLGTTNYTPYVRPGGPGSRWYAYESGQVRCQTQKQAMGEDLKRNVSTLSGAGGYGARDYPTGYPRSLSADPVDHQATPYLIMYVRNDLAAYAFQSPAEEQWRIPDTVRKPRRAQDSSSGAEKQSKPDLNLEKNDTQIASMLESAATRVGGAEAQPSNNGQHVDHPDRGTMDGDDVVMSDIEEDGTQTPIRVSAALDATANGITVEKREYRDLPEVPEPTQPICVNFFAGDYYQGHALTKDKSYHGQGHLIYTNGDEYTGTFSHGLPSGKGTMVYATSGNTYTGDWFEGKHHGHGTLTELATGNVFDGGWKEGKRSGSFVLRGTVTDEDKVRNPPLFWILQD